MYGTVLLIIVTLLYIISPEIITSQIEIISLYFSIFFHQWPLRLFPCLGYCIWCCNEHEGENTFKNSNFFPLYISSEVGLLDHVIVLALIFWNLHTVFLSGCNSWHSHQQFMRTSFCPYPHQYLLTLVFMLLLLLLLSRLSRVRLCAIP